MIAEKTRIELVEAENLLLKEVLGLEAELDRLSEETIEEEKPKKFFDMQGFRPFKSRIVTPQISNLFTAPRLRLF